MNAVLAGAEIAVVRVRPPRVEHLVERKRWGAAALAALQSNPERFLATVQVGITLVAVGSGAYGEARFAGALAAVLSRVPLLAPYASSVALVAVVIVVSYLSIVLGELVPKSLALRVSERYALLVAQPLLLFAYFAKPLVWLLSESSNAILRPFGDRTTFSEGRLGAEELRDLVDEAAASGSVDRRAADIASRAIAFSRLDAGQVMVPRNRVRGIPLGASADEVVRAFAEEGLTRMPVYRQTLDEIVGYVVVKDVLAMIAERHLVVLDDAIRPAHFVPETLPAPQLLQEMQERRVTLAVVVDEHGSVAGIVSLDDLLEELVGELFSEYRAPEELVRVLPDGSAIVRGHAPVREVNRLLGLSLEEHEAWNTIAGLCIALAGRIPPRGSALESSDGTRLEVVEASRHLVRLVRVVPPASRADEP